LTLGSERFLKLPRKTREDLIVPSLSSVSLSSMLHDAPESSLLRLLAAAADFCVVLSKVGVVQLVQSSSAHMRKELKLYGVDGWVGKSWEDLVTIESRAKVLAMQRDCIAQSSKPQAATDEVQWRQINFPKSDSAGPDLPVDVALVGFGETGSMLMLARDLRANAQLQQQMVDTQQTMERDYLKLRFMESRYRALLQTSTQGIALVEAGSLKIHDANELAYEYLGEAGKRRGAKLFSDYFDADSRSQLTTWLNKMNAARSAQPYLELLVKQSTSPIRIHASLLRQADGVFYLVWMSQASEVSESVMPSDAPDFSAVFDMMPDGMLVMDPDGKILRANAAFASMAQLVDGVHAVGERISRWFVRSELDFNLISNALKQHQSFKQISTELKGEFGSSTLVEISGVAVRNAQTNLYGLCIRDVSRRGVTEDSSAKVMPRSVSELKELVGRVSLKDIVGETTDVIEQLCIEAALELTGDNRAAASEMLGLSRQSLYVKLRRFGVDTSAEQNGDTLIN
jgi:transcriptional regulator PpsR